MPWKKPIIVGKLKPPTTTTCDTLAGQRRPVSQVVVVGGFSFPNVCLFVVNASVYVSESVLAYSAQFRYPSP